MKVFVVAIGQRMPDWVETAFEVYRVRLNGSATLDLIEVPAKKRGKNPDIRRILDDEGERLLASVPRGALPIALDRGGRRVDTETLAKMLTQWIDEAQDVAFLVGGPEGLSSRCLDDARLTMRLSDLTFAHPLVRVILAEQIYRAYSIHHGLPYHR
jgi:23S rRNA (pseudouridine1915-N3)-methyltransferase